MCYLAGCSFCDQYPQDRDDPDEGGDYGDKDDRGDEDPAPCRLLLS